MADYSQMKVPDLKKILQERGLVVSGNKADLIARLQEDDKKAGGATTGAAEDEIDWDEDDNKASATAPATTEPAAASAAGGQGPVDTPIAVPNQKVDVDPSTTNDLKATTSTDEPSKSLETPTAPTTTEFAPAAAAVPEAPKVDFSIGLQKTDAQIEAEKREARRKRFDLDKNEERKKLLERQKKFAKDGEVPAGLDAALPERRQKRGREEKSGGQGGRAAKRQTPDRRTEGKKAAAAPAPAKKEALGKVTDDPVEKAKAEARAKRFAKPADAPAPAAVAN